MNSYEFNNYVQEYDNYNLIENKIKLPTLYTITSNQKRAVDTTKTFTQNYITDQNLQEIETKAIFDTNIKLPKILWLLLARVCWYLNIPLIETKRDTIKRVKQVINSINEDTIIVSHGFLIKILAKELQNSGYIGKIDFSPKNSKVYKFVKG
jgi:broad specificity phosphatase PhoE